MRPPALFRRLNLLRFALVLATFILGIVPRSPADPTDKSPPAPETPLVITSGYGVDGLVLWLAADSGVKLDGDNNVSSLTDKTGNFTLTATDPDRRPAFVPDGLNGKPVLRFNPDQSLYSADEFGTALDGAMTLIIVARTNASRTFYQYPVYLGQNRTSYANRAFCYCDGKESFDGQWVSFSGPPVARNAFVTIGVSVNATVTQATFYRNGVQTMVSGLSDAHPKATFASLSPGVTLGAAADPCRGWLGEIAEVLVFDRQLSPAEMELIASSISAKYALH